VESQKSSPHGVFSHKRPAGKAKHALLLAKGSRIQPWGMGVSEYGE
jgi:hypothetical protein